MKRWKRSSFYPAAVAMNLVMANAAGFFFTQDVWAEDLGFSHQVTLHPIAPLPAIISYVPVEGKGVKSVRGVLNVDGDLLIIPMPFDPASRSFRGSFPTPNQSVIYQFQVIGDSKSAVLTDKYLVNSNCGETEVSGTRDEQELVALKVQKEWEILRVATHLLRSLASE